MQEDYILSASKISDQIAMKNIRDHAYETYKSTSKERQGIIGELTTWLGHGTTLRSFFNYYSFN